MLCTRNFGGRTVPVDAESLAVLRARQMPQTVRSTRSSSRAPARSLAVAKTKPTTPKAKATKGAPAVGSEKVKTVPESEARTRAAVPAKATEPPPAPARPSTIVSKGYVPLVNIPPLPPPPKNLKLNPGDKVVHPSHGLGEITAIEHREIGGAKGEFFIIRILDNNMRVMVPRTSAQAAGLRPVMSSKEADKVIETMKAREVAVDLQPWSRRFRAYTEMIKSGSPHEVAKVLRDMYRLKFDKELSFGERRLLDQAKSLLMKELAAAKAVTEPELQAKIDEMFRA